MLDKVLEWFHGLYISLGLAVGWIDDSPESADFQITRVSFSPASPANVRVGDDIKVNIHYNSQINGKMVQIWAYADSKGLGCSYQPSGFESGRGVVTRRFSVSSEGVLESVHIQIVHYSGQEMLSENRAVNYTLIANPEREALKNDGAGATVSIRAVQMNRMTIRPNAKVRLSDAIDVVIDYQHSAEHEVRVWAIATLAHEVPGGYDSGEMPAHKKQGTVTKCFQFHQPTTIDGIYVYMVNVADETIAEQWLDFPIEFVA